MEIYRPFSDKNKKAAEKFLSGFSLTLENLSEPQKKSLMKYIKRKSFLKWDVLVNAICIISIMALSFYYFPKFLSSACDLIPKFVKVNDNNGEMYIKLYKTAQESLRFYIKAGFYLGIWFSSYIFVSISLIIAELIDLRTQKKIFEAFLPLVKTKPSLN
jgi:hypothetical protein